VWGTIKLHTGLLVGKTEGKRPLVSRRHRREVKINMDLQEMG